MREVFIAVDFLSVYTLVEGRKIVRLDSEVFILNLKLQPSVQERSLKAFLDLAILCALVDKAMTGYEINRFLTKKFGIIIGPNTIYSKLTSIERKGWTKSVQNRAGRAYSLTEKGKEITDNMNDISEEIQLFVKTMLRTPK